MDVTSPSLTFPANFCCNCGDTKCESEIQDTRVTRYFAIFGTGTTFHLSLPICAACRRTLRRQPAVFFGKLLVFAAMVAGWYLAGFLVSRSVTLPQWMANNLFVISLVLGLVLALVFYRLRSAKPPKTSFYQPVRIKRADVRIAGVMDGRGQVTYMRLAFTNPDYLNVFMSSNRDAIKAGHLSVEQA